MSRKCVNKNGRIYPSNGIVPGKTHLYSTQGEQVYQSSIKCDVTVQLRGSLNCKKHLMATEESFDARLQSVPKFQIGAMSEIDENEPRLRTKNVLSFVVPVNSQVEAIQSAKKFGSISDMYREAVNKDEKCLVKHPEHGYPLTLPLVKELKQRVSSFNQKVRQTAEGNLLQAGLHKGDANYSIEYGKIMGANRLQLSKYSLRIVISIRHNIYKEFSTENFTDPVEKVAYHVAKAKRYSEVRQFPIDIPVTSFEQYQALMDKLNEVLSDPQTIAELVSVNDSEIIWLCSSEERTDEQIDMDAQLSETLANVVDSQSDDSSKDGEDDSVYDMLMNIRPSKVIQKAKASDDAKDGRKPRSRGRDTSRE